MIHVDWEITAAVGCFFLGLFLIWLWRSKKDEAPPDRYVFKAYVTYLIYLKKLEDCKWYQKPTPMPKFRIADRQKVILTETYYVEAETKEEAIELYTEQLAGSLPFENSWVDEYDESMDGVIEVLEEQKRAPILKKMER